ncbi:MAG: elongation factor P maturation arginine rhamnosyltransferase EarP, partial [Treponema sp.]|nr:elongation factor P maturation arginine rhamnosyltransferase EarP [Treponema sp.]
NCQLSIVNCQFKQVLFFAYPQDWSPVIRAMNRVFVKDTCVKVAAGAGQESILKSCCENNSVFTPEKLSFMDQEDWDKMMHDMDFMIIRGEDSMAQACLTGTPFIWQAYPQKDEYQLVKVNALLNRMRNHFGKEFRYVETAWNAINKTEHTDNAALEENVFDFLKNLESLKPGFISFAKSLYENGDLADNLMTFILKSIRIEKINT